MVEKNLIIKEKEESEEIWKFYKIKNDGQILKKLTHLVDLYACDFFDLNYLTICLEKEQ